MPSDNYGQESKDGGTWYLAQYKPRNLERAELNLRRQGFLTFCPKQIVVGRESGSKGQTKPLFPNYIFVKSSENSANWHAINSTFGIVRLVGRTPTTPSLVTEQFISELKAKCDNNDVFDRERLKESSDELSKQFIKFIDQLYELPEDGRGLALMGYLKL